MGRRSDSERKLLLGMARRLPIAPSRKSVVQYRLYDPGAGTSSPMICRGISRAEAGPNAYNPNCERLLNDRPMSEEIVFTLLRSYAPGSPFGASQRRRIVLVLKDERCPSPPLLS